MKYFNASIFLCVLLLSRASLILAEDKSPDKKAGDKPIVVTFKSMSYEPKKLEVPIGASVVWENKAHSKHTATSDDDGKTFDTGEIKPEESSKPVKFDKTGEFKYHCLIHGKTMSGIIVVQAAAKK